MASSFRIYLNGVSEFEDAMKSAPDLVDKAARNIVEKGGLIIASEAKRQFRPRPGGQRTSKKTGRIYYSFASPYNAVPPTPTSRSGHLQASLNLISVSPVRGGWMSLSGTKVPYAGFVEYGTSHMAKEPYLETSLKDSESKIQRLAEEEWAKVMV